MDKKRSGTSRIRPYSFPCKATRLHLSLLKAVNGGSSDPRSPDFTREAYLRDSFLSKLPVDGVPASLRSSRAIDKMVQQDQRNKFTNQRLLDKHTHFGCASSMQLFSTARQIISEVLGSFTYDAFQGCGFSSGATTSRRRDEGAAWFKYNGKAHVTREAYPYARAIISLTPRWWEQMMHISQSEPTLSITTGNVVFTVPKSSDIDRAAAKEPDLNVYLQKGIGSYIRNRLNLFGINLNDQTVNQELAYRGSLDGALATLDLSSASDSVTWVLCKELLPWQWFDVMSDLRSPRGILPDGRVVEWEMFSSMGNGFTFELESLLFYALTRAVCYHTRTKGVISVYGDDIIVPTRAAYTLRRVLGWCGFKVNSSKSYWDGLFRESCGKHYYKGVDVTPIYCRKPIDTVQRAIWFANKLKAWSQVSDVCDDRYAHAWQSAANLVPPKFWGGRDLESVESLVTNHLPRQKLCFVDSKVDETCYGRAGLLAWFGANQGSSGDRSYIRMRKVAGRFVVRRNVGQYGHSPSYSHELDTCPKYTG